MFASRLGGRTRLGGLEPVTDACKASSADGNLASNGCAPPRRQLIRPRSRQWNVSVRVGCAPKGISLEEVPDGFLEALLEIFTVGIIADGSIREAKSRHKAGENGVEFH